ncbi:YciI family protein [Pseudonocardia kongjuensis]|uniref:YciI family protein n=1 Tax=Pseudonocardia kongjuensis TaxID=102227 RepID=A0ABN1XZG8_9PSEU
MAFFTVVWKYTEDTDLIDKARGPHGAYLKEQVAAGTIRVAGPFEDGTGGILVAEVADVAELKSVLDGDPYVADGVVVDTRIFPFKPVLGALA